MTVKFVLHNGLVKSNSDGQVHHVNALRLVSLYGVNQKDCIINPKEHQLRGYNKEELLHLYPLDDGDQYRVKLYSKIKQARIKWLAENDLCDGTDCVTPFDNFLYC